MSTAMFVLTHYIVNSIVNKKSKHIVCHTDGRLLFSQRNCFKPKLWESGCFESSGKL